MFARNRFPIRPASGCDEMLADMAHAMGCATLVEADRCRVPAAGPALGPVTPPDRAAAGGSSARGA